MTAYTFETITAEQALAFNAATDSLTFASPLAAGAVNIYYHTPLFGPVVVLVSVGSLTVAFGTGIAGLTTTFADGSTLAVVNGSAGHISGGAGSDLLVGGRGVDTLSGGDGADTIVGGSNQGNALYGGAGADLFLFRGNETGGIYDWSAEDRIAFDVTDATAYAERTATSWIEARNIASDAMRGPARPKIVAVQYDNVVQVFASTNTNIPGSVTLVDRTLADVSAINFISSGLAIAPTPLIAGARGTVTGSMDTAHVRNLYGSTIVAASATELRLAGPLGEAFRLTGRGFDYRDDQLVAGVATSIHFADPVSTGGAPGYLETQLDILFELGAGNFSTWLFQDATATAFARIFEFDDTLSGGDSADLIRGMDGRDRLIGQGGPDSLFGGQDDDYVSGGPGKNFLRGEEGDDWVVGGDDTDDSHGNMGNDTVQGGGGDDWVVGGKDDDLLYGDAGHDVVWGNLGNDTCEGGDGDDQVRGGQGDDIVRGGAGNDWLSGDRGTDTITGGSGADIFHTFDGAGSDRATDFNAAEGDRVYLLPGTQFSVAQVGADTVITVTGAEGGTLTLVGVQMSTLPTGWIFGA